MGGEVKFEPVGEALNVEPSRVRASDVDSVASDQS